MPLNHQSSIFVTANTTQVVVDAENLILSAMLTTSSTDSNLANNTASTQVVVGFYALVSSSVRTANDA